MPTRTEKDALHSFLRTRRTIRRFKPDSISPEIVEKIIETASYAPSAHNLQPWRFVIVNAPSTRKRLGEVLTNAMQEDMLSEGALESTIEHRIVNSLRRLKEAPTIILLCGDNSAIRERKIEDTIMSIQSVAVAGLQLILAAHAEELGANWICWPLYAQEETRIALKLPETWEPQAMFFIGSPAEVPPSTERDLSNIIIKK